MTDDTNEDGDRWALLWDFKIDDGQLDGLSPQEIFVLGVEAGRVYAALSARSEMVERMETQIHVENIVRIADLAYSLRLRCRVERRDDHWATVSFQPFPPEEEGKTE